MTITVRAGKDIASAHVDAGKRYIESRDLGTLRKLGALDPALSEAAQRLEGVARNQGADPAIDHLVRTEDPGVARAYFPEERAALPGLWKHLEWEDVPAASPAPTVAPLADAVRDVSQVGPSFSYESPVAIADMPPHLQKTARRVQLMADKDGDAATIQLADIEAARSDPSLLTADELREMGSLAEAVKAMLRGTGALEARVALPVPGLQKLPIVHTGKTTVTFDVDTQIRESRTATGQSAQKLGNFTCQLFAQRNAYVHIDVPPDHQVVLLGTGDEGEHLFLNPGDQTLEDVPAGTYRLELWSKGRRVESSEIALPAPIWDRVDLAQYADYLPGTPNTPLHRNLIAAQEERGRAALYANNYTASWRYETEPSTTQHPQATTQAAALLAAPTHGLAPGRYLAELPNRGSIVLDAFPQNVLRVTVDGQTTRLQLLAVDDGAYWTAETPHGNASYHAKTHRLQVGSIGAIIVTDQMRVA